MSSALACVGLAVSDGSELERILKSVDPDVREIGFFDGIHVGRWQDGSGTTLILGLHDGESWTSPPHTPEAAAACSPTAG